MSTSLAETDSLTNTSAPPPAPACPRRRWPARLALALLAFVLVAYAALAWLIELPAPSGPFAVGRSATAWVDATRSDPWVSGQRREVQVYFWYPAEPGTAPAQYFPGVQELAGFFEGSDSLGIRAVAHLVGAHAGADAPIAANTKPLPVLIFSPGAGTPVVLYTSILEELASQGYFVAAVESAYEGVGQALDDGRVLPPLGEPMTPQPTPTAMIEAYHRRADIRAADFSFVLDQLARLADGSIPSQFAGRIDASRAGVFGHSLGGVAAVHAALDDERFVCCSNLDGLAGASPWTADRTLTKHQPPMAWIGKPIVLPSEASSETHLWFDRTRAARRADLQSWTGGVTWVEIDGMRHTDFSDEPFFYPSPLVPSWANRAERLDVLRRELCRHFDQHLRLRSVPAAAVASPGVNREVFVANQATTPRG